MKPKPPPPPPLNMPPPLPSLGGVIRGPSTLGLGSGAIAGGPEGSSIKPSLGGPTGSSIIPPPLPGLKGGIPGGPIGSNLIRGL